MALDFNVSLVGMDNGLDKTQAKPETSPRTALVSAIEPVEYPRKVPRGNPYSIVFYRYFKFIVLESCFYFYTAALLAVLDGVVQEVGNDLFHAAGVHKGLQPFGDYGGYAYLFFISHIGRPCAGP